MDTEKFFNTFQSENKVEQRYDARRLQKTLVRQISVYAHSEVVGMLPEANGLPEPSLRNGTLAKIQDRKQVMVYIYMPLQKLNNGEIICR